MHIKIKKIRTKNKFFHLLNITLSLSFNLCFLKNLLLIIFLYLAVKKTKYIVIKIAKNNIKLKNKSIYSIIIFLLKLKADCCQQKALMINSTFF